MKLKLTIFLIVAGLLAVNVFGQKTDAKPDVKAPAPPPALPAVKDIIDKYVQAIGGRAAIEEIQSRYMKGTVTLSPMGVNGTVEAYAAAPDKSYQKLTLAGLGEFIEGFDGTTAWSVNPLQGNRDKTGDELTQTKLTANFYREINLDKLYPKMEVKGVEKVGDRDAYVVVATPAGLDPQTFYFDKESGLLVREDATMISPQGKMAVKTFSDDFRAVDGVKMPFKIRAVMPQFEIQTTLTEIKNKVKFDNAIFTKPKE
ncbi:MAG: hypothetical protein JSS81_23880 [Acidobacteria bacterium]|nr:hypothetical protein [Acidobacteriota bacterium]